MRLRDVSGIKGELAALTARHERLVDDMTAFAHAGLIRCPSRSGRATAKAGSDFVNAAYSGAVEAADPNEAVERNLELLDQSVREDAARTLGTNSPIATGCRR